MSRARSISSSLNGGSPASSPSSTSRSVTAAGGLSRQAQFSVVRAVESLAADLYPPADESLDWAFGQSRALLLRWLTSEFAVGKGYLAPAPPGARIDWTAVLEFCHRLDAVLAASECHALKLEDRLHHIDPQIQTLLRVQTAVSGLTSERESPHLTLSAVYQHLARYRPVPDGAGARLVLAPDRRKHFGQFYTPPPVADLVVAAAFEALPAHVLARPRLLDPCMGTGVFLLAALRRIVDSDPTVSVAEVAETCLFGVETDPAARELAVLGLWLETGARPQFLARNIRRADYLQSGHPECQFDVILGNPPWGVSVPLPEWWQPGKGSRNRSARSVDSFKLFLELAARLTGGVVGMIVPQAVLTQTTNSRVRESLLKDLAPYWVASLGDGIFSGAAAPACALVFGPRPGPNRVTVCDRRRRRGQVVEESRYQIPASHWNAAGFPLTRDKPRELFDRLQSIHPCLGSLTDRYVVRDAGLNYNRVSVARRSYYRTAEPEHPRDIPCYRGRDFTRYGEVRRSGWLRYDARQRLEPGELLSFSRPLMALPEKIAIRQTADDLVATLDRTTMVMGRSVLAITAFPGVSLPALLACLNSRLLTVLYRVLAGEEGRILPQVKVARLRALPIPALEPNTDISDSLWRRLDAVAHTLLDAHGNAPETVLFADHLVYQLYGLSPSEIALIEA